MTNIVNPYAKKQGQVTKRPQVSSVSTSRATAAAAARTVTPNIQGNMKKKTTLPLPPVNVGHVTSVKISKKSSMKQKLKQEIALLKRKKTLAKLQQESEQRRLAKEREKQMRLRQIEQERIARQKEKEERQRLKEAERQSKELERQQREQERFKRQEEKRIKEEEQRKREQEAYQRYILKQQQHQQQMERIFQQQMAASRMYAAAATTIATTTNQNVALPKLVPPPGPVVPVASNIGAIATTTNQNAALPKLIPPDSIPKTTASVSTTNSSSPNTSESLAATPDPNIASTSSASVVALPSPSIASTSVKAQPQPNVAASSVVTKPYERIVAPPNIIASSSVAMPYPTGVHVPFAPHYFQGAPRPMFPMSMPYWQRLLPPPRIPRPAPRRVVIKPPTLCKPMESPSPFADTHFLVTVTLMRPIEEKSFGVSLKLHHQSSLVDPEWLQAQKQQIKTPKVMASSSSKEELSKVSKETKDVTTISSNPVKVVVQLVDKFENSANATQHKTDSTVMEKKKETEVATELITKKDGLDSSSSQKAGEIVAPSTGDVEKTRRRRRRRANFSVMMVLNAEKQNAFKAALRKQVEKDESSLQPDDIVVSIGGTPIAGMTFSEACAIFSSKVQKSETDVSTKLVVARRKKKTAKATNSFGKASGPVVQAPRNVISPALSIHQKFTVMNNNSDFQLTELAILADCIISALHQPSRLLGQPIWKKASAVHDEMVFSPMSTLAKKIATLKFVKYSGSSTISLRASSSMVSKWLQICSGIESNFVNQHQQSWNKTVEMEGGGDLTFTSDAERSALRQMPRPPKGCRCKVEDHEYLHDPKCNLYRDICRLVPKETLSNLWLSSKKVSKSSSTDLNVVQAAFKDRFLKLKSAAEMEEGEARFVAHMEEVQVKECKKAVFAPTSLATMVLSTVFELQREFPISKEDGEDDDEDDDEEEEEVTLAVLGTKRKTASKSGNNSKRPRQSTVAERRVSFQYLLRMLQHISKVWGHVYREPSHEDFAWRWEVFHGHNSEDGKWDSQSKNPRTPNSFPFATFKSSDLDVKTAADIRSLEVEISQYRDAIEQEFKSVSSSTVNESSSHEAKKDESMNCNQDSTVPSKQDPESKMNVAKQDVVKSLPILDLSQESIEYYCLAAHLLSPSSSGLYDEVMALVKMEILEIHSSGTPVLTSDWYSKVDMILLDDMENYWSSDADPEGRFCVHYEMRDTLEEQWIKSEYGWSTADDPNDLVYDLEVVDEWREAFQGQMEERANYTEGVGRFGL